MAQAAKHSFEIRVAQLREADAICELLRRSITELCVRDHQNDPRRLAGWLDNKTPEQVACWITGSDNCMLVAVADGRILGVGSIKTDGEIALNYVSPEARFQGVSRAMLLSLEAAARERGCRRVTLTSTFTAHEFYIAAGYVDYRHEAWEGRDWPLMEKTLS
jgi:GNAT superfamily N-acetyltransferase